MRGAKAMNELIQARFQLFRSIRIIVSMHTSQKLALLENYIFHVYYANTFHKRQSFKIQLAVSRLFWQVYFHFTINVCGGERFIVFQNNSDTTHSNRLLDVHRMETARGKRDDITINSLLIGIYQGRTAIEKREFAFV